MALVLGRNLHWVSGGDARLEKSAIRLLAPGYRALGREALASIAEIHHRHQRLRSVGVLQG